jgi:hypothetical protein
VTEGRGQGVLPRLTDTSKDRLRVERRGLRALSAEAVEVESVNGGMARVRIVPFRCEECGGAFAATAGGLCHSCDPASTNRLGSVRLLTPLSGGPKVDRWTLTS